MSEKYEALLTAGVILAGLGVYFFTIRAGVVFGAVLLVAGVVTFAIVLRRAVPAWRAARRERAERWRTAREDLAAYGRDWYPDGFWNPERLFKNGVAIGALWLGVGLVQSIWSRELEWFPIILGAVFFFPAGVSLAVLLWRRRRTS